MYLLVIISVLKLDSLVNILIYLAGIGTITPICTYYWIYVYIGLFSLLVFI